MKRMTFFFLIIVFTCQALFSAEAELSGVFDSTVNFTAGAGDSPAGAWGIEEFANLRLRVGTGGKASFFAALNLIAMAGNYLETAGLLGTVFSNPFFGSTPLIYGQNFAAALELERLYFRINGDYIDAEAGLLRLNFGYGQIWGSSDFLNSRNPLFPNARPRGVLGMDVSFYPADSLKLMAFAAAPRDPLKTRGGGIIPGLSLDQHWDRASVQVLYAFETPSTGFEWGIHRFGLSVKADLELGFVVDALYTLNPAKARGINSLSVGTGFDYNFLDGSLYVILEYLFNGSSSATSWNATNNFLGWMNHHFIYGMAMYRFNDYCSLALSAVLCFDDLSFQPMLSFDYEFFQGFSLNLSARLPLDRKTFGGSKTGELGPIPPNPDGTDGTAGARFITNAGVRLRF